jgi:hypothetical protein
MEPNSGIEVFTRPEYVRWYADSALTAVCAQVVELEEKAIDAAFEKSPNVLREGTRARAHATYATIGYDVATSAIKAYQGESWEARTQAVAGAVKSVVETKEECRRQLRMADAEQLHITRTIYKPVLPALEGSSEAARLAKIAGPVRRSWSVAGDDLIRLLCSSSRAPC